MLMANFYALFSRPRWYLVPLGGIAMTLASLANVGTVAGIIHAPLNQWDVLLGIFNEKFFVAIIIPTLFCGLTMDFLQETDRSFAALFIVRCRSRRAWVLGKLAMVGVTAIGYVVILFGTAYAFSCLLSTPSLTWSAGDYAVHFQVPFGLAPRDLVLTPPVALALILAVIVCGLIAFGSFVAALTYLAGVPSIGIACAALCAVSSFAFPNAIKWLPTLQMELNYHIEFISIPNPVDPTLGWTFSYDALVLITALGLALVVGRYRDA